MMAETAPEVQEELAVRERRCVPTLVLGQAMEHVMMVGQTLVIVFVHLALTVLIVVVDLLAKILVHMPMMVLVMMTNWALGSLVIEEPIVQIVVLINVK
jgi:hypothetical protein